MARVGSDRENLLREATALVERIEVVAGAPAEHVVVGFRADGALSVFFGADPVYQFNAAGELRRAYCDGLLFKALSGRLVSLQRVRQQHEVQLARHELSNDEQTRFLSRMRDRLRDLAVQLDADRLDIVGQVPADADVLGRIRQWFADHDPSVVARTPHARA